MCMCANAGVVSGIIESVTVVSVMVAEPAAAAAAAVTSASAVVVASASAVGLPCHGPSSQGTCGLCCGGGRGAAGERWGL